MALAALALAEDARAFGQEGAFHPRVLLTGNSTWDGPRNSALARWSWELIRRTSAPAKLTVESVAADAPELVYEPFAVWYGEKEVEPLTYGEVRGLRRFLRLGGLLFVDDSEPEVGVFGRSVRRELARVLPDAPVTRLQPSHVVYKSYYLVEQPVGRVQTEAPLEAMLEGKQVRVLFSSHDLLGALARDPEGSWTFEMQSFNEQQRVRALRMAVNIAMYVLCSDYKDDQVHAKELMRRRGRRGP